MPIKRSTLRSLTGGALALATLATRLPLRGRTLFEFDSVDFVVATVRFNLEQVTPHVPGNILHIFGARLLLPLVATIPDAYSAQSILLSIGAVLLLWRAAAQLRGERVGLIAATLWLTAPLFWFIGCVATAYIQEAFYCSALLYVGIKWIREPSNRVLPPLLAGVLALAIGARQNDVLFFAPAVVWLFVTQRRSVRSWWQPILVFTTICLAWGLDLIEESGGLAEYIRVFSREQGMRSQSMLFGNSWHHQLDATAKFLFMLPVAMGPPALAAVAIVAIWPRRCYALIRQSRRSTLGRFALWLAMPSFAFYLLIYFMKAGYLLTLLPVIVVAVAVMIDMAAIWWAETVKSDPAQRMRLTRPIITRNAIVLTLIVTCMNVLWFTLPWPGTDVRYFFDEETRNSYARGIESRLGTSRSLMATIGNRMFSTTNVRGIWAIDSMNHTTLRMLNAAQANTDFTVIIATWWDRQSYLALPKAHVYDIQPMEDTIAVGVSHHFWREAVASRAIHLPPYRSLLLLIRHDHPDFAELRSQLEMERLQGSDELEIYRARSAPDTLHWRKARFITR
jgi:hypothetical protein